LSLGLAAINLKLLETGTGESLNSQLRWGKFRRSKRRISRNPSFLSNRNRTRSLRARQWPPMVEQFFPPFTPNDLSESFCKREREREKRERCTATGAHVNGTTRVVECIESTPENCSILEATWAFHGRTNASPHSTFYLCFACSIAWQRSSNRRSRRRKHGFFRPVKVLGSRFHSIEETQQCKMGEKFKRQDIW